MVSCVIASACLSSKNANKALTLSIKNRLSLGDQVTVRIKTDEVLTLMQFFRSILSAKDYKFLFAVLNLLAHTFYLMCLIY